MVYNSDGSNVNLLEDLNNDGYFDDISPGNTITIQADMTINDYYSSWYASQWDINCCWCFTYE